MNKSIGRVALMTVVAAALTQVAVAQPEHLPSPHAEVSQTIGLSDVTVSFHRPGVKGREIWGNLVPYGAIWRAGANASTTLTFERDVKIGGETVKAGTYGLFVLPTETQQCLKREGTWRKSWLSTTWSTTSSSSNTRCWTRATMS